MKLTILTTVLALASGAVLADPVEIETARGPASVEQSPQKVAVYDIAALDTLLALGVTPAGVPEKVYLPRLAEPVAKAAKVGTLFEPDLEALSALNPDLTIVGGRSAPQFDAVSQVGPAIDMTISPNVVGDLRARLAAYGSLFNKQDAADDLTATLDDEIAAVRAEAQGRGTALIVLTNGPKISAYGRGSRFGWLHSALGIPEAYPNLAPETHGDAISFEFIAEVNPDWLFVIDRGAAIGAGGASARETLDNPLVAGTKAAQNGHIVYLDAGSVYVAGGGYTALMTTLEQMRAALVG
ncbi:iron ABC transporter substrate-binding protein [Thioclava marina]|uniref:Iron ABC transporter substrate-binding protein n=1 Tax=Thioclava marina TaxID=1915077 RepID=A0ABX3MPG6_9RHOB|nr:siderophore ABC transporter substrate-binding protein [Thioclava marina]OOY11973.1 iron ABC transporter substrate-binding protein [Thioclava marina]